MKKLLLFVLIALAQPCFARIITVASLAELQSAIDRAAPGDVVLLKAGVYEATSDIIVRAAGTEKKRILIAAANAGATEISGKGGFRLDSVARYVVISGFRFTHAASRARSDAGSRFCRWTQNIFETPGDGENLTIAGNDTEVDHNTFRNKHAMGRFLAIRGAGKQIAERLWIHHNYFKGHTDQGGRNGAEAFQFGLSGFSLSLSKSIVEHNLFEECAGENELISIKASGIVLRYNTIRNCPAQFTLRHGNFNEVYGNYFTHTPGLRIFGDDHIVYSNHFDSCSMAINIGNGGAEVADGAPLTSHDRPDRVLIAFNTLVHNRANIVQTERKEGLGSTYITVMDNLIVGGPAAASIKGPVDHHTWAGNMIFETVPGNMPEGSYQTADPRLEQDQYGAWHLRKGSPAIDAAAAQPRITTDMDGQERRGLYDIGADEFAKGEKRARMLQAADVGAAFQ
jgi:poly(beta-D-mannuronate) lyase